MCGIVGARNDWLIAQGLEPTIAMRSATHAMAWRGPDSEVITAAGDWWLGCARLAISGPRCRQPVVRRGGRFVAAMNGAITNARQLWQTFAPRAATRKTPPNDAWLPLLAVAAQQLDRLQTLRGHHAYAVVDRETGELILGQDRYGEKPLHCLVARIGKRWQLVAFASTLGALRQLGMPEPHSHRRLAEWMRYGFSRAMPHRFSARLRLDRLPKRGEPFTTKTTTMQWCEPAMLPASLSATLPATLPATQPLSTLPPTTGLRERLIASVGRCIDSPSPSGLFLSGGIDSSCLALALGALGEATPAYNFHATGTPELERKAAEAAAMAARLPLHFVDCGPEVLDALPRLTQLAGQPLGDPSILAVHAVAQVAADDGVRIMLGGEGADELLLGYRRYQALQLMPRLTALRPFGSRWSMHKASRYWRATIAKNPIRALLAVTPPALAPLVLSPLITVRRCFRDCEALPDTSRGMALAARDDDLNNYLPQDLLPKVDVALLAAGIEGRCPYLEAGIEEFGTDVDNLGKRSLRLAFASELPEAVAMLPKLGFSLPLDAWFRGKPALLDVLLDPLSQQREHLRPGGLSALIDRHRRGTTDLGHALYLLIAYELHLRSVATS